MGGSGVGHPWVDGTFLQLNVSGMESLSCAGAGGLTCGGGAQSPILDAKESKLSPAKSMAAPARLDGIWKDAKSWTGLRGALFDLGFSFSCPGMLSITGAAGAAVTWVLCPSSWKQAWCEHMHQPAWSAALTPAPATWRPQKRRQPHFGPLGPWLRSTKLHGPPGRPGFAGGGVFLGAPPSLKMLKWEKLPSRGGGNGVAAIEHGRAHVFNQRSGGSSNIGSADDVRPAIRGRRDSRRVLRSRASRTRGSRDRVAQFGIDIGD